MRQQFKIPQEMSKAKSKIPVENASADFFLLNNVVCSFSWKKALNDKKALDSWSSSQTGSSKPHGWKDEHSRQVIVMDELYFEKIYKEVQTKS